MSTVRYKPSNPNRALKDASAEIASMPSYLRGRPLESFDIEVLECAAIKLRVREESIRRVIAQKRNPRPPGHDDV